MHYVLKWLSATGARHRNVNISHIIHTSAQGWIWTNWTGHWTMKEKSWGMRWQIDILRVDISPDPPPSLPPSLLPLSSPETCQCNPVTGGRRMIGDKWLPAPADHSTEAARRECCHLQLSQETDNWALTTEPIIRDSTHAVISEDKIIPRHENKRNKRNVFDQAEKEVKNFSSLKFCSQSPHRIWLSEQSVCRSPETVEVSGGISSRHQLDQETNSLRWSSRHHSDWSSGAEPEGSREGQTDEYCPVKLVEISK